MLAVTHDPPQQSATQVEVPKNSLKKFMRDVLPPMYTQIWLNWRLYFFHYDQSPIKPGDQIARVTFKKKKKKKKVLVT